MSYPQAPLQRRNTWSLAVLAVALLTAATVFFVQSPPGQSTNVPISAKAPAAVPSTAPTVATATAPVIATETPETPDPQTQAMLSEPTATAATAATSQQLKEPPNPPSIDVAALPPRARAKPTTHPSSPDLVSIKVASKSVHAPPQPLGPARQPLPDLQPIAVAYAAPCTNLLTQLSLGEPLNARQRGILESQCR